MSGNLLKSARLDSKRYIKSGGFEEDIILESPSGVIINTKGFASKHHLNFDTDGTSINAKNAHIGIDEDDLKNQNYPVRDINGEVNLRNHVCKVKDSSGVEKKYIILEHLPDETLGLIVCFLRDLE